MPTYEFRCPDGHDFEKFYRSIGAAPSEVQCPTCGKVAARQLSAGGGLLFKGSGFYITDYGKDGKKSQAAVPAKGGESTKAAGDAGSAKSESGSADKSSVAGTGDAGSKTAASESKPAAAPEKKPKTSE
jgi:putative FmdB family regulatory protein